MTYPDAPAARERSTSAREFEPVSIRTRTASLEDRHAHVHEDYVGAEGASELDRLPAVARLTDDLDPVVGGEDRLERLCEQPMVVCDEDAERLRLPFARAHPPILAVSVDLWKRTSGLGSRSCS